MNAVRTFSASTASPTAAQLFAFTHEIDVNSLNGAVARGDDPKSASNGAPPTIAMNATLDVVLSLSDPTTKQLAPGEHEMALALTPTGWFAPPIWVAGDHTPLVEVIVKAPLGDEGVVNVPIAAQSPGAVHETATTEALVTGPVIEAS